MESLPTAFWKRLSEMVGSVQQQAPAARMIGKFVVQQATTEIERRVADLSRPQPPRNTKPHE